MRKIFLLSLCLVLIMLAVCGLADEKQKATLEGPRLIRLYDPSVKLKNMTFVNGGGMFAVEPAEIYETKLNMVEGDEALFKLLTMDQKSSYPILLYLNLKGQPKAPSSVKVRLTGESENAYLDDIIDVVVEPCSDDNHLPLLTDEVHIDVGEPIDVIESFIGEGHELEARMRYEIDPKAQGYVEDDYGRFIAEQDGIYKIEIDLFEGNAGFSYNVRIIAGDPQETDDSTNIGNGKTELSVDSYDIKGFKNGKPLYCKSEKFPNIKLRNYGTGFSLSKPVNLNLTIELVDGDSFIKDLFKIESQGNGRYILWRKGNSQLTEPGQATFRITGEDQDYFVDETFPVKVVPYEGPVPELKKSYIQVDLDTSVDLNRTFRSSLPSGLSCWVQMDKNANYERTESGTYIFHEKGIYPGVLEVDDSNIEHTFAVNIYAGDYPYLLSAESGAFPGSKVQINADTLMVEASRKEIEYSVEGNDLCTIDDNGLLSVGESAIGSVTVKAKPAGTDLDPSELTLSILGYNGTKEEGSFSEESNQILDMWENNPVYITPRVFWGYRYLTGSALTLDGDEKVTKLTVTPVEMNPGREKLVNVQNNAIYIDQSLLYDTAPETASYFVVAEGQKHYAQRLLTIHTERVPDESEPKTESVVFVKPGELINLFDYIQYYPKDAACIALVETDKRDEWSDGYSHENGKKNIDLVPNSEMESIFTAYGEGRYPIKFVFSYGNLEHYKDLVVISSETLEEKDFALTLEDVEIAAGQKVVFDPVFANPEHVNSALKNADVDWSIGFNGGQLSDYGTMQNKTFTAKQNIDSLKTITVTYTSTYCPTQSATSTVIIHPKATGIEAAIDQETLYMSEEKDEAQITASALPEDALQKFKYASSNAKVASVDENGRVTALASGKTVISVTVDDGSQKKAQFNVEVIVPVTAIDLETDEQTVDAGKTKKIKAIITPEKPTNARITWSVAEEEMAEFVTVSREGNVSIKGNCPDGRVTIVATAEGSLPETEVSAEIKLEIVGKEQK